MTRHAILMRAVLLSGLSVACARAAYNCVEASKIPGACPPDTGKHGTFSMVADSVIPTDSLVGHVFAQPPLGTPIYGAKVSIASETTSTLTTDSTGRFAAPRPASPAWTVTTQMIGYQRRVDTVRVGRGAAAAGLRLRIGLDAQPLDGGCDYLICDKRP